MDKLLAHKYKMLKKISARDPVNKGRIRRAARAVIELKERAEAEEKEIS